MTEFVGTVKKLHTKNGGGEGGKKRWTKHSLLVEVDGSGEETWFTAGFGPKPKGKCGALVEEGHRVKFDAVEGDYGHDITEGTLVISKAPKQEVSKPASGGGGGGRGGYVDRNTSIVIQNSRGAAISVVEAAIATDSLPVPKGKSAGDRVNRFNLIVDLIDKLTVRYAHDLVADINPEEFRVFGVVADAFGEGVATPLPDPAAEAPADLEEPPETPAETETDDEEF